MNSVPSTPAALQKDNVQNLFDQSSQDCTSYCPPMTPNRAMNHFHTSHLQSSTSGLLMTPLSCSPRKKFVSSQNHKMKDVNLMTPSSLSSSTTTTTTTSPRKSINNSIRFNSSSSSNMQMLTPNVTASPKKKTSVNIILSMKASDNVNGFISSHSQVLTLLICILALFTVLNSGKLLYVQTQSHPNHLDHLTDTIAVASLGIQQQQQQEQKQASILTKKKARVLMGIFTSDRVGENIYRNVYRDLFKKHPKVCSLYDYQLLSSSSTSSSTECELIYTFVLGGNPDGPTEIVSDYDDNKIPVIITEKLPNPSYFSSDLHENDMTFLNIKENKNEGKSQTWFYYASSEMEKYGIEYSMKMDSDTLIQLDRYFTFADHSLPPAPYNNRIIAGTAEDKAWWKEIDKRKEEHFYEQYSTMHLYTAGKMYIMSKDLVQGVAYVAANVPAAKKYAEGVEDHDISMMAFLAAKFERDNPIRFVMIPNRNPWFVPINIKNGVSVWKKTWYEETQRIKNLFTTDKESLPILDGVLDIAAPTVHGQDEKVSPTTILASIPIITTDKRSEWRGDIAKFNVAKLADDIHQLDVVQMNNTIAPSGGCFLQSGHLDRPVRVVEFNADGGKHWFEFVRVIKEKLGEADIIILNQMDLGMTRSGNTHTTEMIAIELGMNYVWGLEFVDLTPNEQQVANGGSENVHGFSGQAILSKCQLYDPMIVRDRPDDKTIVETKQYGSAMGIFVRTGTEHSIAGRANHITVGSVNKLNTLLHKNEIWKYQFGQEPESLVLGIPQTNQIGSIIAGTMDRELCKRSGLVNLDTLKSKRYTWPARCNSGDYGTNRTDNFCGNMMRYMDQADSIYLPCVYPAGKPQSTQISTHSIISILLH